MQVLPRGRFDHPSEAIIEDQQRTIDLGGFDLDSMIHDLNNQLQCAMSAAHLLRKNAAAGETSKLAALASSAKAAIRGAGAIASRLCGSDDADFCGAHGIEVEAVFQAIIPMLRLAAGENILIASSARTQGFKIRCGVHALESAILNLVLNASEALPTGGLIELSADLVVTSHATGAAPATANLCMSVRDNGQGMSEAVRLKACEPYQSTKSKGRLSGLGLASVRNFVEGNGGWMTIESRLRHGTNVSLFLPAFQH